MHTFRLPTLIFGTRRGDTLFGTAHDDIMFGLNGSDVIDAGAGDDIVFGGSGDDLLIGGGGDNLYSGDFGFDTLDLAGPAADYTVHLGHRPWSPVTLTRAAAAPEGQGTDTLIGVEAVHFAADDYTLYLDGRNNAVLAHDDAATTAENAPLQLSAADLLANDRDFDGDALSLVSVDATSAAGVAVSLADGVVSFAPGSQFDYLQAGETATDSFGYVVSDGRGGDAMAQVVVTVTGVNDAPELVLPAAVDYAENGTDPVATAAATDVDSATLSFRIAGGDDAALFAIDANTGALTFLTAPDYETPQDAGGDNVYNVSVAVDDGDGGSASQDIAVTVTDVAEAPPPQPVISEIMYNPASAEPAWEWVEIYNAGSTALDLAGWVIDDNNSVAHGSANIAGGVIAAGHSAVLYNADALSAADFTAAWGAGIDLVAVSHWSALSLNNSGDTLSLWSSFDAYQGDNQTHANAVTTITYTDGGDWPDVTGSQSIYLTDLAADPTDGANWAVSSDGGATPLGTGETAAAAGGNSGADIGSPGGAPEPALVLNEIAVSTTGTDWEFAELKGTPGMALDGVALIQIDGDGDIRSVTDFSGATLGDNGYVLAASATAEQTFGVTGDISIADNTFTNVSSSYLLVAGWDGTATGDLDTDDDGVLDSTPWASVIDSVAVIGGDAPLVYADSSVGPDGSFLAAGAVRVPDGTGPFQMLPFSDQSAYTPTPGASDGGGGDGGFRTISEVQGTGDASTFAGQTVTIEAIVVGDFQNGDADGLRDLGGFWLQEEAIDQDGNPLSSEGIFVYEGAMLTDVHLGDRVMVTGTVAEHFGETELDASSVTVTDAGAVADVNSMAVDISLAANSAVIADDGGRYVPDMEAYEGMLVHVTDTMTVNEAFQMDRFNEIRVSADGRPAQFTQGHDPDAAGYDAYQQQVGAHQIVYDDGLNAQNAPILAEADLDGSGSYDTADGFGMGDTVDDLTGVLNWGWAGNSASGNTWRIRGVEDGANDFQDTATREDAPPDVGGTLKVASFNVLNYFTTLDTGSSATTLAGFEPRGANTAEELARQTDKLVTTLVDLDADVLGLTELENDFSAGPGNAIAHLVAELNVRLGGNIYDWVRPGSDLVGDDAISVGMIYKVSAVTVQADSVHYLDDSQLVDLGYGDLLADGTGVFNGDGTNRAPLEATFVDAATGEDFSVAIAHMKSKGSGDGVNADQHDGAGASNAMRVEGVDVMTHWLDTVADEDRIVLGDFNSYAQEDPIDHMTAAGYGSLEGADASSYVFDGETGTLDYAFANAALAGHVTGAETWHINSPEPDAEDYNLDFGRDPAIFDASTPWRTSDHDPVVVGLDFADPLAA